MCLPAEGYGACDLVGNKARLQVCAARRGEVQVLLAGGALEPLGYAGIATDIGYALAGGGRHQRDEGIGGSDHSNKALSLGWWRVGWAATADQQQEAQSEGQGA